MKLTVAQIEVITERYAELKETKKRASSRVYRMVGVGWFAQVEYESKLIISLLEYIAMKGDKMTDEQRYRATLEVLTKCYDESSFDRERGMEAILMSVLPHKGTERTLLDLEQLFEVVNSGGKNDPKAFTKDTGAALSSFALIVRPSLEQHLEEDRQEKKAAADELRQQEADSKKRKSSPGANGIHESPSKAPKSPSMPPRRAASKKLVVLPERAESESGFSVTSRLSMGSQEDRVSLRPTAIAGRLTQPVEGEAPLTNEEIIGTLFRVYNHEVAGYVALMLSLSVEEAANRKLTSVLESSVVHIVEELGGDEHSAALSKFKGIVDSEKLTGQYDSIVEQYSQNAVKLVGRTRKLQGRVNMMNGLFQSDRIKFRDSATCEDKIDELVQAKGIFKARGELRPGKGC